MSKCQYGSDCYRKNEDHIKECHPEKLTGNSEILETKENKKTRGNIKNPKPDLERKSEKRTAKSEDQDENEDDQPQSSKRQKSSAKANSPETSESVSDEFKKFWAYCQKTHKNPDISSLLAKIKNAKLVGPFELLQGTEKSEDECLHCFSTDLPEMQSFLTCDDGRYAIWRDHPEGIEGDNLIVYASNDKHLPKIEVVGDTIEHVVVHLSNKDSDIKKILPNANIPNLRKQMKAVVSKRKKVKFGSCHDVGIWVKIRNNDIGYRPATENPDHLKRDLKMLATTTDDYARDKKLDKVLEIYPLVHMANDESDFGMGLEYGHFLYLANTSILDGFTVPILEIAYKLLNRNQYIEVLNRRMKMRGKKD
ncbi:hypothetical protein WR25_22542 [Diploscapter pachys]|uniref:PBZ-type domain-containing protein n=1 Tax=Diploscapter pachys TaxID=2018661 RepID=A0A2A2JY47_9BILA|nr:hypothetical protein WR25_22542 [Diploscapter pachys]